MCTLFQLILEITRKFVESFMQLKKKKKKKKGGGGGGGGLDPTYFS